MNLSYGDFCKLFGPDTFRLWLLFHVLQFRRPELVRRVIEKRRSELASSSKEYPVPEAIAKLLRLMVKLGLKPGDVP